MQIAAATSNARYAGQLSIPLPKDHPAWTPGYEGEYQIDPRIVVVGRVVDTEFASLADAVKAAQQVSAGAADAVAVVRNPGVDGPWLIERLLAKGHLQEHYAGIDLEGVALRKPRKNESAVYQPLNSQRQVIVGAVVDGPLVYDQITRYRSTRPDLPGRNPDGGRS